MIATHAAANRTALVAVTDAFTIVRSTIDLLC